MRSNLPPNATYDERVAYFTAKAAANPHLAQMLVPRLNSFIPNSPSEKQTAFLLTNDNYKEALYGGAAGGGKTDALLMAALQYVNVPNYSALILRRTYGQLNMPDSILNRAHQWLRGTAAEWEAQHNRFVWPNGAMLQFGYLQYFKDVYQYDGAAFQFVAFDELTQFLESQYTFLFGRLRRLAGSSVPVRMRAATNPGGIGHLWVKDRFIKGSKPGRIFIPAKLADNPFLDVKQYRVMLAELDGVTRRQREEGDWDAEQEGTVFLRQWFSNYVDEIPNPGGGAIHRVRYWDLAATLPKAGSDPDWTVGALLARDRHGKFWIEDITRFRKNPGEVQAHVYAVAEADGKKIPIRFEQEPGASGKSLVANYVRLLTGWNVDGAPAGGSKLARWMPFAAQCKAGNVGILNGPWNHAFFEELTAVPEATHDDQADAVSGAFRYFVEEFKAIRPGISRIGVR